MDGVDWGNIVLQFVMIKDRRRSDTCCRRNKHTSIGYDKHTSIGYDKVIEMGGMMTGNVSIMKRGFNL